MTVCGRVQHFLYKIRQPNTKKLMRISVCGMQKNSKKISKNNVRKFGETFAISRFHTFTS